MLSMRVTSARSSTMPLAAWDDGANLGVEDVGELGDQLSVAMDDDHFVGTFKFKGEAGRSWLIGHRAFSVRNRGLAESGSEKFLIRRLGWRGKS